MEAGNCLTCLFIKLDQRIYAVIFCASNILFEKHCFIFTLCDVFRQNIFTGLLEVWKIRLELDSLVNAQTKKDQCVSVLSGNNVCGDVGEEEQNLPISVVLSNSPLSPPPPFFFPQSHTKCPHFISSIKPG